MYITQVKLKNFKSIGGKWVTIDFEKGKMTLVRGVPGTGKTTILSSIVFALFGKSSDFKGTSKSTVSTSELINDINKKEMEVQVHLSNGYTIKRGLKPSIFQVLDENGNDLAIHSSKTIDQDYLELNLLNGLTYDIFLNTIYLSSKPASTPFIYMSSSQRKEYIEKILDLSIINNMNEHLKSHVSTNKMDLIKLETEKNVFEQQLIQEQYKYNKSLEEYNKDDENEIIFNQNKEYKIKEAKDSIYELEQTISAKNQDIEYLNSIDVLESDAISSFKIQANQQKELQIKKQNELLEKQSNFISENQSKIDSIEEIKNQYSELEFRRNMFQGDIDLFVVPTYDVQNEMNISMKLTTAKQKQQKVFDNIKELKKARDKKQMELDTFIDNKSRYGNCGDCEKLSYIIGSFSIEEANKFIEQCNFYLEIQEKDLNLVNEEILDIEKQLERLDDIKKDILLKETKLKDMKHQYELILNNLETLKYQYQSKEKELNQIKVDLDNELSNINEKINTFEDSYNQTLDNIINKEKESLKNKILMLEIEIESATKSIENKNLIIEEVTNYTYNKKENPSDEYVKEVQGKLNNIESKYNDAYNKSVELQDLKKIINDKEHKAKALKSTLPIFEQKLNQILDLFMEDDEFSVTSKLKDDFELVFFKNGKEVNVFNLSSGQQACVSLATTFSFLYLLNFKNTNSFDMLFIDELLDTNIAGRAKNVIKYLKEVSKDRSIDIISHNTNLPFEMFDGIINVQKEGKFSIYSKES